MRRNIARDLSRQIEMTKVDANSVAIDADELKIANGLAFAEIDDDCLRTVPELF